MVNNFLKILFSSYSVLKIILKDKSPKNNYKYSKILRYIDKLLSISTCVIIMGMN